MLSLLAALTIGACAAQIETVSIPKLPAAAAPSAQLVIVTPAPLTSVSALAIKQDQQTLQATMARAARAVKKDGVVAAIVADHRTRDGFYRRHDALEQAARWAGLEVFNHEAAIDSFEPSSKTQNFSHVLLLRPAGAKERRHYSQQFLEEPWLPRGTDIRKVLKDSFTKAGDKIVSLGAVRLRKPGSSRVDAIKAAPILENGWAQAVKAPTPEEVLETVVFRSAATMPEVKTGSAKLVMATPPYLGAAKSNQAEDAKLLAEFFKEADRVLQKNGALVTFQTDYRGGPRGTLYMRHDAVRRAAEAAGFEVFDAKIRVRRWSRDLFRKGYSHMMLYRRKGERPRLEDVAGFSRDAWVLPNQQLTGDWRWATPPEIYDMAMRRLSKPGDLVVNAFAGSATGNVVALGLGRKVVGYELSRKMIPVIKLRAKGIAGYFSAPAQAKPGKLYKVIKDGKEILSPVPGKFAGWRQGKIFGRLDCASGKRLMKKENRVFFLTYQDAIKAGYRPCKKCRPKP